MSKKASVMVDDWKLPVFKKLLGEAGFAYVEHKGITDRTINLVVDYEFVADIQPVIEQCQRQCRKNKKYLKNIKKK